VVREARRPLGSDPIKKEATFRLPLLRDQRTITNATEATVRVKTQMASRKRR